MKKNDIKRFYSEYKCDFAKKSKDTPEYRESFVFFTESWGDKKKAGILLEATVKVLKNTSEPNIKVGDLANGEYIESNNYSSINTNEEDQLRLIYEEIKSLGGIVR